MIRRHRPFLVLLVLGVLLRVVVMVGYRPAIFYVDSLASYLLPLPGLDPTGQDPIGYDVYVLRPLLDIGNITLVVAVQHLLGLGLAGAGYALFEALLVAALVTLAWPDRPGWAGAAAAGLLLGLAATVREVGAVLIAPLVLYALVAGGRWGRRGALAAVAALAFVVPVAAYVNYYHDVTGKYALPPACDSAYSPPT